MHDKNFRLSEDVRPVRYRARLALDPAVETFEGRMVIDLTLARPQRAIVLHAVDLEIRSFECHLQFDDVSLDATATTDPVSETVVFELSGEASAGPATLAIDYRGRFSPGLRGLYLAGPVAVTQFEAADARRAFPCFDEPAFKASWEIQVEVPADLAAISNGAIVRDEVRDGRRVVTFAETPPISSYLVALVVGRLVPTAPLMVRGIPVRTFATPEKVHLCAFAQVCADAVLPLLSDYFGVPYAFGKLDQIGIPDFEAGAMENVGAITFREVALLCDPETAPLAQQKRIAEVVTHEAAHMWFGNLVTMVWWDDLWLNEAFATWMAYKIVHQWRPAWRIGVDADRGRAAAFALDALKSTHPIRTEVRNAGEAGENFDAITYDKGGAVLRMIEGYLGEETFRAGIQRYIRRHAYANATADDLWRALGEASGQPVTELANSWIGQSGHPLVEVAVAGRTLRLRQRRYYAAPALLRAGGRERWLVPLRVRYADAAGVHEQRALLGEERAEVALPGTGEVAWLEANAGGDSFVRVAYDEASLRRLADHLDDALDPFERMALIADQWALLRAGAARPAAVLDLYARFGGERDRAVLEELGGRLAAIEERLVADADRPAFARFVGDLVGPTLEALGWDPAPDEDDETRLRRAVAVSLAGLVARAPAVIAEAVRRFDRFLDDPRALDPNLIDPVVIMVARAGDARRFEQLLGRLDVETDPATRRRYLLALGSFEAPELTTRAVELLLTPTVPLQEMAFYLARLLDNRVTREPAWTLLRSRFPEIKARAVSPQIVRRFVKTLAVLPSRRHLEEVEDFLARTPMESVEQAVAQTLERMRLEVDFAERVGPEVSAWLRGRDAGTG